MVCKKAIRRSKPWTATVGASTMSAMRSRHRTLAMSLFYTVSGRRRRACHDDKDPATVALHALSHLSECAAKNFGGRKRQCGCIESAYEVQSERTLAASKTGSGADFWPNSIIVGESIAKARLRLAGGFWPALPRSIWIGLVQIQFAKI